MFLFEFDLFGIIYTVCAVALFVLLAVSSVLFAVRKRSASGATVVFRVLDIILTVILLIGWVLYVFGRLRLSFFNVSYAADYSLVLTFGSSSVSVPELGRLIAVWERGMGTLLYAAVTATAVLSLVLSFALRRRGSAVVTEESVPQSAVPEYIVPVETVQPTETVVPENSAETAVSENIIEHGEAQNADNAEAETDIDVRSDDKETEEPAEENAPGESVKEDITDKKLTDESVAEQIPVDENRETDIEQPRSETSVYDYLSEKRGPSAKVYSSALQRPGAKKKNGGKRTVIPAERVKPVIPPPVKPTVKAEQPRVSETVVNEQPLPVTRRLVITNRLNVVNIFNDYLKEKDEAERKKLSESIEQIELGEK